MSEFTLRQLEKCAEREVALRRNVFAKRGMTAERRIEIAKMEAIAGHFKALADDAEIGRDMLAWAKHPIPTSK